MIESSVLGGARLAMDREFGPPGGGAPLENVGTAAETLGDASGCNDGTQWISIVNWALLSAGTDDDHENVAGVQVSRNDGRLNTNTVEDISQEGR